MASVKRGLRSLIGPWPSPPGALLPGPPLRLPAPAVPVQCSGGYTAGTIARHAGQDGATRRARRRQRLLFRGPGVHRAADTPDPLCPQTDCLASSLSTVRHMFSRRTSTRCFTNWHCCVQADHAPVCPSHERNPVHTNTYIVTSNIMPEMATSGIPKAGQMAVTAQRRAFHGSSAPGAAMHLSQHEGHEQGAPASNVHLFPSPQSRALHNTSF